MAEKYIGIIGGSGLYQMAGMRIKEERAIPTPFGEPSDKMIIGELDGVPVAFMSRHGKGHRFNPSEVNYRANIFAFKKLGVTHIVAGTAVGSMKESLVPGSLVIVDQFIDRTRMRPYTFYEDGVVVHVSFADPVCAKVSAILAETGLKLGAKIQTGGCYVCIEGPMFSSRAESKLFRSWGVDVIGMTGLQEAKLAREAEICYATIAMVTDYDCWHEGEADVDVQMVISVMKKNVKMTQEILKGSLPAVAALPDGCSCQSALKYAIMTDPACISAKTKQRLAPLLGKYLK